MSKLDPTIEELLDLKKSFNDKKKYEGYMVKQVIDARIESLGVKIAPLYPPTDDLSRAIGVNKAMSLDELVKDFRSRVADMVFNDEEPITTELLNKIDGDFIEALTHWADEQRVDDIAELDHKASMRQYDPVSWQAGYDKGYKQGRAIRQKPLKKNKSGKEK